MGRIEHYTGKGSVQINFGEDEQIALVIHFRVAGWSDPGQTYGPPERCYPPEGDEEREVTGFQVLAQPKPNEYVSLVETYGSFTQDVNDAFFGAFGDKLNDAPYDLDEPDYPEPDDPFHGEDAKDWWEK